MNFFQTIAKIIGQKFEIWLDYEASKGESESLEQKQKCFNWLSSKNKYFFCSDYFCLFSKRNEDINLINEAREII
jgi:hypothetical protein